MSQMIDVEYILVGVSKTQPVSASDLIYCLSALQQCTKAKQTNIITINRE